MSTVRGRTEVFTRCQLYVVRRMCLLYQMYIVVWGCLLDGNCTW